MKIKLAIAAVFTIIALILGYKLGASINNEIENQKNIKESVAKIQEKLLVLKNVQIGYQSKNKSYSNNWGGLKDFLNREKFYFIDTRDTVYERKYLADSLVVIRDTIGSINVSDSLLPKAIDKKLYINTLEQIPGFKNNFTLQSNKSGTRFEIRAEGNGIPTISIPNGGKEPFKVGSLNKNTTKANWLKK